uniref:Uncharacterized protein n=1 Tax=Arundo donax TaxID=35708 RepID=A0A0A9HLY4_ARUDO
MPRRTGGGWPRRPLLQWLRPLSMRGGRMRRSGCLEVWRGKDCCLSAVSKMEGKVYGPAALPWFRHCV